MTSQVAKRPSSVKFWAAYLNYDSNTTSASVWNKIGGNIGKAYGPTHENSCAARVSYGLNYSEAEIEVFSAASFNFKDQEYNGKKGDEKRYIVSAEQLEKYLTTKWGARDHEVKTQEELKKVVDNLGSKSAIFATKGHSGVLKKGYTDPYVNSFLPVKV